MPGFCFFSFCPIIVSSARKTKKETRLIDFIIVRLDDFYNKNSKD